MDNTSSGPKYMMLLIFHIRLSIHFFDAKTIHKKKDIYILFSKTNAKMLFEKSTVSYILDGESILISFYRLVQPPKPYRVTFIYCCYFKFIRN